MRKVGTKRITGQRVGMAVLVLAEVFLLYAGVAPAQQPPRPDRRMAGQE